VPYKAREVLARLKRAGFVVKRQSGDRTWYYAMQAGDRLTSSVIEDEALRG